MSKEMLDVLVDQEKVKEIAALPTAKDVQKKLKEEGIDATPDDVKVLGQLFDAAANKLNEDELGKIGGGKIDWKSKKAKLAYAAIGTALAAGAAYEADKHFNEGKGWTATKGFAVASWDSAKHIPGNVKGWFSTKDDA